MFPTNEMFAAAEVAYRRERAMQAARPRRRSRRIRLSTFPKIRPLSVLSRQRSHWVRAA